MPNKKKLYEALKAEGYDNFADESSFNAYVDNVDLINNIKDQVVSLLTSEVATITPREASLNIVP